MGIFEGSPALRYSGLVAGTGMSGASAQYKFVKFSADNTVVLCAATTDIPAGVLQEPVYVSNSVSAGDAIDVVYCGQTLVQAGASITAGTPISTNASGQAQAAVAGQYVVGVAVNVAGATTAGTLITAVINCAAPIAHA